MLKKVKNLSISLENLVFIWLKSSRTILMTDNNFFDNFLDKLTNVLTHLVRVLNLVRKLDEKAE